MNDLHFLNDFARIVAALLIVIDPLGVIPVITTFTRHVSMHETRLLVIKVTVGATVLLLFFTVTGTWVLEFFGVTLSDLRIGGGLLLLIVAFRLVITGRITADVESEYEAAVAPLISPILVGPGAITAAVVLAAVHGIWITAIAVIVAMLISMLILLATPLVHKLLGAAGTDLVSRIMGVLIAAIAISYIRIGLYSLIHK